ncbi:MAG: ATP-binding cassette domain-containing protein [Planctomycetota bacterium]
MGAANTVPVEIHGLERRFGRRTALAGVDLEVFRGEIVGVVGPNGSGKTTLLRVVAGLLRPDAGEVRVFGRAPFAAPGSLMEVVRFAFAPPALYPALTAMEHLRHLTAIRTSAMPRVTGAECQRALEAMGLADRAHERVAAFSLGMRQRLALALAILPPPELLVLDEPTHALDPFAVLALRDVLAKLRADHGTAILLSSRVLAQVETLVDRLLVLHAGCRLFWGRPGALLDPESPRSLEEALFDRLRAAGAAPTAGPDRAAGPEGGTA